MVLRRWESETRKFGFVKRVDKGRITTDRERFGKGQLSKFFTVGNRSLSTRLIKQNFHV